MTRSKVVLVPFPFEDLSTIKVRPAVCLTDPTGLYRHVILAFITSRIPVTLLESDVVLDSGQTDFATTGLRMSSTLRLYRLITVTTTLIRRELGELSLRIQDEVAEKLCKLFSLESAHLISKRGTRTNGL